MGRRIVDWNARILRDRHHDQRKQRKAERNAQSNLARRHMRGHDRKLCRSGDQSDRKHDHQHCRFRERGDHDLAARPDAAKACSDVQPGKREKETRTAQQRDQCNQIGRPGKQQTAAKRRHQGRRNPGAGENNVRNDTEQP